jgi:hypothetical protein
VKESDAQALAKVFILYFCGVNVLKYFNALFQLTSAKINSGIDDLFEKISAEIIRRKLEHGENLFESR